MYLRISLDYRSHVTDVATLLKVVHSHVNSLLLVRETSGPQYDEGIQVTKTRYEGNNIVLYPINPLHSLHTEIKIFNTPFSFLVDTGAAISLISEATWKHLPPECCKLEQWTHQALTGVEGSPGIACSWCCSNPYRNRQSAF